jgi:hypothetical protein
MKIARSLVLALLLLVSTSGAAAWLDLARDAPLQVLARCQARSSHWEGGAIFTESEVAVLRVVRGQPDSGFTVRQRGGEVDGIGQKVGHGGALLEPGETYLLFLVPDDLGRWSPISTGVNKVLDLPDLGPSIAGSPLEDVLSALGGAN